MSKLNPQKASAYVGPGVLRKGGKITKVPNGPLIKKKGPYAGSTLKSGGAIKKAQNGTKTADSTAYFKGRAKDMARQSLYAEGKGDKKLSNVYMDVASKASSDADRQKLKGMPGYDKNGYPIKKKKAFLGSSMFKDNPIYKKTTAMRGMIGNAMGIPGKPIVKNGSAIKKAQNGKTTTTKTTKKPIPTAILPSMQTLPIKSKPYTDKQKDSLIDSWKKEIDSKFLKKKAGGMIKRADGSYSKRGLWDNIRANKGSGKKPTAAMLKQERKIKAKK